MTEANSARLSIVQRTSFDTAAALNMLVLPTKSASLRNSGPLVRSETIRSDPNVQDHHRLTRNAVIATTSAAGAHWSEDSSGALELRRRAGAPARATSSTGEAVRNRTVLTPAARRFP